MAWVVIERWESSSGDPCPLCAQFVGQEFPQGVGPTPGRDTHHGCQCTRVPVRREWVDDGSKQRD